MNHFKTFILTFNLFLTSLVSAQVKNNEGITFNCEMNKLDLIKNEMEQYFSKLRINREMIIVKIDSNRRVLNYVLNTPESDTQTLDFFRRPELGIKDEIISLPMLNGAFRKVKTVSQKEIVYALFQHGRNTVFSGDNCSFEAFRDNVGIRQNTVAWVERMEWNWPNGGSAQWNKKYWKRGTPIGNYPLAETLSDTFKNQKKYAIGCYTATKIAMAHGVVDYYARVKKDPVKLKIVTEKLLAGDKEPLVDVEPGRMWYFEDDFDPKEMNRAGKILQMQTGVAPKNFVPGDWSYFLNTDKITYQHTGYEGSNSIYLGRDRFDDYYHDQKNYHYTFREKLDEVFQWRNKVFSRSRDADKIQKLSEEQMEKLTETPEKQGLILDYRVYPIFF